MPTTSVKTRPGTRKLSDVARHLVVPTDISSTGWPAVRKTCTEKLGITFDDWQDGAGRVILAKRPDGNLAAMIDGVGMSLPRQVGKTYLIGALTFALCVNTPGLLVIWSAHHARTHGETFLAMQAFTKRGKVAAHVQQVFTGSGDEEIRFHNGSRILFGARERGFGRGIPGVDILIFDEAQILSDRALSNMLATMNTSRFGLALYIGTPPKPEDMSESFRRMRTDALDGNLADGAWIEFGADPDADPDNREQWAKANPSYPLRTPAQSILRLRKKLTPSDFRREGMGIWDQFEAQFWPIPEAIWSGLKVSAAEVPTGSPDAYGLDMSHSRDVSIGVCVRGAERDHVEVAAADRVPGDTAGVVEWLAERCGRKIPVVVDQQSPAASMIPALKAMKVRVVTTSAPDMAKACGGLYDAALEGRISHFDQAHLNAALAGAKKRDIGTAGGWGWDRRSPETDISPLVAITLARFGAENHKPTTGRAAF